MAKRRHFHPDTPLLFADHKRPMTRRDFISRDCEKVACHCRPVVIQHVCQPKSASAALSQDLQALRDACRISVQGAGKIPFISFDLAGGANIAGSNVLVGGAGGQLDFLSTAGYNKLGLPGDMVPSVANPATGLSDFINTELGLAFHSDSSFLRGILEKNQC